MGSFVVALVAGSASAQATERQLPLPPCVSLGGNVLDASRMRPLTGATVTLTRDSTDSQSAGAGCVAPTISLRTVVTGDPGRYRFDGLPPGTYTVRVQRLGYKPATVGVVLRSAPDARVSIGLTELPVTLQPLAVQASPIDSYGRTTTARPEGSAARIAAALDRRERTLGLDAREITHADVEQAVTLGESDVFRGAQRLAGITTRDEYSAEFWARGGRWDQTRVLVDGLPLFSATHAFGAYSAVNPDAVGSAVLHLGVRPTAIAEGGSAVMDVRTRRGGDGSAVNGFGELSLVGGRLALDRTSADNRTTWMLAGRRSHLDLGSWALERIGVDDVFIPYHFSDLVGRAEHAIGGGRVEVSGLYASDGVTGDVPQLIRANRSRRTSALGRVAVTHPVLGMEARVHAGISDFGASIRRLDQAATNQWVGVRSELPMRSSVQYVVGGADLRTASSARHGFVLGSEIVTQRAAFEGPARRTFAGQLSLDDVALASSLSYVSAWSEYQLRLPSVEIALGARADMGGTIASADGVRVAPRAQGRVRIGEATYLSLGAGRSFQYAQALPPASGLGRDGLLYPTDLWVVANKTTPALRTDLATAGVERQWGSPDAAWIATANVFARRSNGVVMGDVTPGPRVDGPLTRVGSDRARGWELSVRRLANRWSTEAAYSVTNVETTVDDLEFTPPYHRPHVLDVTFGARLSESLRASMAFSAGSGVAYTRVTPAPSELTPEGETVWTAPAVAGAPSALRTSGFRNADIALEWTRPLGKIELGVVGRLHNVLGRGSSGVYRGNVCRRVASGGTDTPDICERRGDRFEAGLPLVPSFAVRLGF